MSATAAAAEASSENETTRTVAASSSSSSSSSSIFDRLLWYFCQTKRQWLAGIYYPTLHQAMADHDVALVTDPTIKRRLTVHLLDEQFEKLLHPVIKLLCVKENDTDKDNDNENQSWIDAKGYNWDAPISNNSEQQPPHKQQQHQIDRNFTARLYEVNQAAANAATTAGTGGSSTTASTEYNDSAWDKDYVQRIGSHLYELLTMEDEKNKAKKEQAVAVVAQEASRAVAIPAMPAAAAAPTANSSTESSSTVLAHVASHTAAAAVHMDVTTVTIPMAAHASAASASATALSQNVDTAAAAVAAAAVVVDGNDNAMLGTTVPTAHAAAAAAPSRSSPHQNGEPSSSTTAVAAAAPNTMQCSSPLMHNDSNGTATRDVGTDADDANVDEQDGNDNTTPTHQNGDRSNNDADQDGDNDETANNTRKDSAVNVASPEFGRERTVDEKDDSRPTAAARGADDDAVKNLSPEFGIESVGDASMPASSKNDADDDEMNGDDDSMPDADVDDESEQEEDDVDDESDQEEDDDDNVDPPFEIEEKEAWTSVWDKLLGVAGWYMHFHDNHSYYVKPAGDGYDMGRLGVDYFDSLSALQKYIRKVYHWKGAIDVPKNASDGGKTKEAKNTETTTARRRVTLSTIKNSRKKASSQAKKPPRSTKPLSHRKTPTYKTPLPKKQRPSKHKAESPHWWKHQKVPTFAKMWPLLVKLDFRRDKTGRYCLPFTTSTTSTTLSFVPSALRKFLCRFGIPNFTDTQSRLDEAERTKLLRWICFANVPLDNGRNSINELRDVISPKTDAMLKTWLVEHGFESFDGKLYIPQYRLLEPRTHLCKDGEHRFSDAELNTTVRVFVRGAWRMGLLEVPSHDQHDIITVAELLQPPPEKTKKLQQSLLHLRLWAATSSQPLPVFKMPSYQALIDPFLAMEDTDDSMDESDDSDDDRSKSGSSIKKTKAVVSVSKSSTKQLKTQAPKKVTPTKAFLPSFDTVWPMLEKLGFKKQSHDGGSAIALPDNTPGLDNRTIILRQAALRKFLCQFGIPNYNDTALSKSDQDLLHRWAVFANVPAHASKDLKQMSDIVAPKNEATVRFWLGENGFFPEPGKIYIPHYNRIHRPSREVLQELPPKRRGMSTSTSGYQPGVHFFFDNELSSALRLYVRGAWRLGPMGVDENNKLAEILSAIAKPMSAKQREAHDHLRLWAAASPAALPTFTKVPDESILVPFQHMRDEDDESELSSDEGVESEVSSDEEPTTRPAEIDAVTPSNKESRRTPPPSMVESPDSSVASTDSLLETDPKWYLRCDIPVFKEIWPSLQKLGFEYKSGQYGHREIDEPMGNIPDVQIFCAKFGIPSNESSDLSSADRLLIHRWASFAHVDVMPSKSRSVLARVKIPTGSQIKEWLGRLNFKLLPDGKIYPPGADHVEGGRDSHKHKVHFFNGLAEIRDYIRGAAKFSLADDDSSRRSVRTPAVLSSDEMLSLRLWAALSDSPLPTLQFPKEETSATSREVASQEVEDMELADGVDDMSTVNHELESEPTSAALPSDEAESLSETPVAVEFASADGQGDAGPLAPKSPPAAKNVPEAALVLSPAEDEPLVAATNEVINEASNDNRDESKSPDRQAANDSACLNPRKRPSAIMSVTKPAPLCRETLLPHPNSPAGSVASVGSLKQGLLAALASDVGKAADALFDVSNTPLMGEIRSQAGPSKRARHGNLDSLATLGDNDGSMGPKARGPELFTQLDPNEVDDTDDDLDLDEKDERFGGELNSAGLADGEVQLLTQACVGANDEDC